MPRLVPLWVWIDETQVFGHAITMFSPPLFRNCRLLHRCPLLRAPVRTISIILVPFRAVLRQQTANLAVHPSPLCRDGNCWPWPSPFSLLGITSCCGIFDCICDAMPTPRRRWANTLPIANELSSGPFRWVRAKPSRLGWKCSPSCSKILTITLYRTPSLSIFSMEPIR